MPHVRIAYGLPGLDEGGARAVVKRLESLPGVHDVTVWTGEQQIDVDYDPDVVTPQALTDALRNAGYVAKFIPRSERWPG